MGIDFFDPKQQLFGCIGLLNKREIIFHIQKGYRIFASDSKKILWQF
jgi:hypothetical protein